MNRSFSRLFFTSLCTFALLFIAGCDRPDGSASHDYTDEITKSLSLTADPGTMTYTATCAYAGPAILEKVSGNYEFRDTTGSPYRNTLFYGRWSPGESIDFSQNLGLINQPHLTTFAIDFTADVVVDGKIAQNVHVAKTWTLD